MRRNGRLALVSGLCAGVLVLAGCGSDDSGSSGDDSQDTSVKVGLAFDIGGEGDKSFNDAAAEGLKLAGEELDVQTKSLSAQSNETDADKEERLRLPASGGYNPVVAVGFAYSKAVAKVAPEFPDVDFAIIDDAAAKADNVANLIFAEEQGSYLVGAAAAMKSTTSNIGYIGGCLVPLLQKFQAGFAAGAQAVKPNITVQVKYLSNPPSCAGFNDTAAGKEAAKGMYDAGADVIYAAAGGSSVGVFEAAQTAGKKAIGVDSDQYEVVGQPLNAVIMTSMVKRVDTAVFDFVTGSAKGEFEAGTQVFDLKNDGVGYSTSGGMVDDIADKLNVYEQDIIDGKIKVPTTL